MLPWSELLGPDLVTWAQPKWKGGWEVQRTPGAVTVFVLPESHEFQEAVGRQQYQYSGKIHLRKELNEF